MEKLAWEALLACAENAIYVCVNLESAFFVATSSWNEQVFYSIEVKVQHVCVSRSRRLTELTLQPNRPNKNRRHDHTSDTGLFLALFVWTPTYDHLPGLVKVPDTPYLAHTALRCPSTGHFKYGLMRQIAKYKR